MTRHADCPRCGLAHYLTFRPLSNAAGPYSLWATCGATGEPVLALERPLSLWNFIRYHVSRWPRSTVTP